jgi:lipopolysaccharide export system permease protein
VFKKLDKLVLQAFIGPFVATFFITLVVLLMQFFWLYIDDFVGKGLGPDVILEFIWYQAAVLVPLALPLAVLLSSLMTFGNLGESYELVAIRSAGISLLRFMQPLMIVTLFICGIAFAFSNYIIPVANLKSRALLTDIVYAKPAFDLKEGVFYDKISNFAIKVGKKEKDTIIRDIIIYEQRNDLQDNFIIATDGIMRVSDNKRFLEFYLRNGWRYEERGNRASGHTEYIRLGFKEYKKQFDLGNLGSMQRTADTVYKGNARVLSMRQLNVAMDSIRQMNSRIGVRTRNEVMFQTSFVRLLDSNMKKPKPLKAVSSFNTLIPDTIRPLVHQRVSNKLSSMTISNQVVLSQYKDQEKSLRLHQIEWNRKLSLSFACMVLFMIGAPLGSIIRKGGLGTPMVFAIVFFMLFYFSSTMGEKFAKEGSLKPFVGMWMSTIILLPVGLFITYKAMHDSTLFSKEFYFRMSRKFRAYMKEKKS